METRKIRIKPAIGGGWWVIFPIELRNVGHKGPAWGAFGDMFKCDGCLLFSDREAAILFARNVWKGELSFEIREAGV